MRQALAIGVAATFLVSASAAPTKPKESATAHSKKTTASAHGSSKKSAHTTTHAASSQSAGTRVSSGRYRTSRRRHVAAGPSYQLHPDPERYQQIQRALADRGYFKGDVNGQWGDDSVDAMKRFQTDQKLNPDGKIDSLTLIGLGLGPKHDALSSVSPAGSAATAAPTAVPQNTPDAQKPATASPPSSIPNVPPPK